MSGALSKSLLDAFIAEFVAKSKALETSVFTRRHIAKTVFPTSAPEHAKSRLSECCSPRCPRPLSAVRLSAILDACRSLLRNQYKSLSDNDPDASGARRSPLSKHSATDPDAKVRAFEAGVCTKLRIGVSGRATVDDFRIDRRLETATCLADLGLPDVAEWRDGSFNFEIDLSELQRRSIEVLEELVPQIAIASDDKRRLDLLHFAVSISYLNHPGTKYHQRAFNLAMTAAGHAQLLLLGRGYNIADDFQRSATRLTGQLHWARLIPTLDSPTNYTNYALRGKRMPTETWAAIQGCLEETIIAQQRLVQIDPTDERAIRDRSGVVSMKGRLLAVMGDAAALREADKLQRQSREDIERLSYPYGLAYPVIKEIVRGKLKSAIRQCESAVELLEKAGSHTSAAAFAALLVQLSHLYGTGPTCDEHIRRLAAAALASPSTQYQCSHVFDADSVRPLLTKRGRKRKNSPP